jgi:hypothetical protein
MAYRFTDKCTEILGIFFDLSSIAPRKPKRGGACSGPPGLLYTNHPAIVDQENEYRSVARPRKVSTLAGKSQMTPKSSSNISVRTTETAIEPKQPRRFEKKRNILIYLSVASGVAVIWIGGPILTLRACSHSIGSLLVKPCLTAALPNNLCKRLGLRQKNQSQ